MSQLDIQRNLTAWFIAMGPPTSITLVPVVQTKVAGKGVTKTAGTPRASQQFKVIWDGSDGFQNTGEDGTHHRYNAILVGLYDCKAEIGDTWSVNGQKYYIHSEYPYNGYERKFGLYSYGKNPSDGTG